MGNCYAAKGDFRPLRRENSGLDDSICVTDMVGNCTYDKYNNTVMIPINIEYNQRGTFKNLDDPDLEKFNNYYLDVTVWIERVFIVYLVFDFLLIIMHSLDLKFKGNKGKFFAAVNNA